MRKFFYLLVLVVFILSGCGVPGCLDKTATNYNSKAKHDCKKVKGGTDYSCCKYPIVKEKISGCIDPTAYNYNPKATSSDGSCYYLGCIDKKAYNYDKNATKDDGSCIYNEQIIKSFVSVSDISKLEKGIDKGAALVTLGSYPYEVYHQKNNCEIHVYYYRKLMREFDADDENSEKGLTSGKKKYDTAEKELLLYYRNGELENIINDNSKEKAHAILCFENSISCNETEHYLVCSGCMDDGINPEYPNRPSWHKGAANNYNPDATQQDGSCEYDARPLIIACMDSDAKNYNAAADIDDRTLCDYCPCGEILNPDYDPVRKCNEQCIPDPNLPVEVSGCTDELAYNYDENATDDNGSCKYCPCDTENYYYEKNTNWSKERCKGEPCIKRKRQKPEANKEDKDCTLCDVLELDGKIGIELKAISTGTIDIKEK
jgi:hypothetical protein